MPRIGVSRHGSRASTPAIRCAGSPNPKPGNRPALPSTRPFSAGNLHAQQEPLRAAPPLADACESGEASTSYAGSDGTPQRLQTAGAAPAGRPLPPSPPPSLFAAIRRRVGKQLASFPLAITELLIIAGLCAVGTVIEQGAPASTYMRDYPDGRPVMGFLTWRWILGLSLDHMYTSPLFLALLLLLAASLAACTSNRQLPMVRIARRWSFQKSPATILKMETADTLERARVADLATLLAAEGFEVFSRGPALYAFRGLVGRFAPIGVHAALLLIMAGGTLSALGGWDGTAMTPEGLEFPIGAALAPNSPLALADREALDLRIHVNNFEVDYREDGQVKQFYSDLSVIDGGGRQVARKTISVNDPLRARGVTVYQTDWAISAVEVRAGGGAEPFRMPMADLDPGGQKSYGTFIPLGAPGADDSRGITILAKDLQMVAVYDSAGSFVGVRRPGSRKPIEVDGVELFVDAMFGSTGLELKMDPGVPLVYAGFGALMLTSALSYLSHSQVWALQEGTALYVGGRSNRAKLGFKKDLNEIMDLVPEVVDGAPGGGGGGAPAAAESGRAYSR